MKTKLAFVILPVSIILVWFFSEGSHPADRGPHGGEIKPVDNFFIEMKSEKSTIYAYFLDNKKMTVRSPNITCEAKLMYADSSVLAIEMLPFGTEGFIGQTAADNYNTCLITFTIAGEKASAVFENTKLFATNQ